MTVSELISELLPIHEKDPKSQVQFAFYEPEKSGIGICYPVDYAIAVNGKSFKEDNYVHVCLLVTKEKFKPDLESLKETPAHN
jgi:hypothetical protein